MDSNSYNKSLEPLFNCAWFKRPLFVCSFHTIKRNLQVSIVYDNI